MEALVRQLNDLCDAQPFHTGWYLKDLRTGATADRHGNVVVPSASTRKIAIMMTALQGVHAGDFTLDQPVTIQAKYQHNNSGCFQHLKPGFTITFRDALVMMIIVSDNTCTGTVADMVGLDRVNALCRAIGMVGTAHRHGMPPGNLGRDHAVEATNATTPADVGLLLDCILAGTRDAGAAARLGCTPALCQLGLDILSWQKLNARMPMLMPPDTKIAHKTGTGARNYNDAGIVFQGDDPLFILTVYTESVPDELPDGLPGAAAAQQTIAHLTRACWDALKSS
jgi:beta-lactamase class A